MVVAPLIQTYVVDTHSLVWYFTGGSNLSAAARVAFDEIDQGIALGIVPTIVLAEIVHLAESKRITLSIQETIARLQQATNFGIVPFDLMVLIHMIPLRTHELHDRAIIATAKSFNASLITKDQHIRNSGVVSCVW